MAEEKKNWLGPYIPEGSWIREIIQQAKLAYYLMLDPRVHPLAKLIPIAGLVYVISPIDLIADVIPGLGQADDIAVIMFAIRLFMEFAPPHVVHEHLKRLAQKVGGNWDVVNNPPPPPANEGDVVEGTFRKEE